MISLLEMRRIFPRSGLKVNLYYEHLLNAMREFDISNPRRQAAFLATLGHESGGLYYVREIASGKAYEGRSDLGNTQPGDGVKYKGRGLIQITGRSNYVAAMMALGIDCLMNPEVLEEPENACRVSAWFWKSHGLNELADRGEFQAIQGIVNVGRANATTKRINGWADRLSIYERALPILA